jgi:DNA-directed RNA polymerase subunit RPC12/RpoP
MRPLDATELLNAWEHGLNQPILQRALILILTACPELDSEAAENMSIGARDARLLRLREWIFGTRLLNTAQCPQCGERVEWEGRTRDLRIQTVDDADLAEDFTLEVDNYRLHFRLPTSKDIAAVMAVAQSDGNTGAMALVKRCVVSADQAGDACNLADLPQHALDALSQQIEKLDPQAEIRTALTCPACSHQWEVLFDIAGFLWTEINNWAERTLRSVNLLASAYGWTEREILSLSPVRRQLYQGMVNR